MAAVLNWAFEATCAMFYIVHPRDLALGDGDKAPDYLLTKGIPMFFIFCAVEWVLSSLFYAKEKGARYRLRDFICSSALGAFQTVGLEAIELGLQLAGLSLGNQIYTLVYDHLRLCTFDSKEYVYMSFVLLLLGRDCGYYWCHRFLHEYHLLWTAHSVHHSGEDYNMGTGLRQGLLQPIFTWPFYVPLALLGFHPTAHAAHAQLNTLYMFWIHTELVDRLPWP